MERPPTSRSGADFAHQAGRAIASAIPVAGGPIQVVFENVFSAPIDRRKQAWLERLADVVTELQNRVEGLTPESLAENEVFVTVAMQASQIAIRNHRHEKLDALRNAVLNSGLPGAPHEDDQAIFVNLVDQLTPWHLRVLVFLNNPLDWMDRNGVADPGWSAGAVATVLEHCFPELRGQRDTYDQIIRDLQADGLIGQGQFMQVMMTGRSMTEPRTIDRGKRFLAYISAP